MSEIFGLNFAVLSVEDLASIDVFGDAILEDYDDGQDAGKTSAEHNQVSQFF